MPIKQAKPKAKTRAKKTVKKVVKKKVSKTVTKKQAPKSKLETLYEDDNLLIINKPAGLMVHGDGRSEEETLADIIKKERPEMIGIGEVLRISSSVVEDNEDEYDSDESDGEAVASKMITKIIERPGIVHRLDRDTTGVLVLCKTKNAFREMKTLFKSHKVKKVYRAIVEGNIKDDTGIIDAPIARARSDFRKRAIVDHYSKDFRGQEREALTRYKVLARSEDKQHTFVECYPLTGRTHQIRVHMRGIRHPIIGDALYGSRGGRDEAVRCMLHAYKLSFEFEGKKVEVVAPMPSDMDKALAELGLHIG